MAVLKVYKEILSPARRDPFDKLRAGSPVAKDALPGGHVFLDANGASFGGLFRLAYWRRNCQTFQVYQDFFSQ
jgi:hypothetical protein